jgi:hypothetical protein
MSLVTTEPALKVLIGGEESFHPRAGSSGFALGHDRLGRLATYSGPDGRDECGRVGAGGAGRPERRSHGREHGAHSESVLAGEDLSDLTQCVVDEDVGGEH